MGFQHLIVFVMLSPFWVLYSLWGRIGRRPNAGFYRLALVFAGLYYSAWWIGARLYILRAAQQSVDRAIVAAVAAI